MNSVCEVVTLPYRRRTTPLLGLLSEIGLALAGRAGARLAAAIGITVHRTTLIRLVRDLPEPELTACPEVLEVAWDEVSLPTFVPFLAVTKIGRDGRVVDMDHRDMLDRRTDRVQPNGYRLLPPTWSCDKGNACHVWDHFATDHSHLPETPSSSPRPGS